MPTFKTTLGDSIEDKRVECRVAGCDGHWVWTARDQLQAFSKGKLEPPKRMCPDCYALYRELEDRQVVCARPECECTWTWKRGSQLDRIKKGRKDPPNRLCQSCRGLEEEIEDEQVTCRLAGCDRKWTWTARQQLKAGGAKAKPPRRMCQPCYERFRQLEDEQRPCRISACKGSWVYSREQQIRDRAKGRDAVRERMCEGCYERFKTLKDLEVECRVAGCSNTWRYPRLPYLQQWVEAGTDEPPAPPSRMCPDCSKLYSTLEDREVECKTPGCAGTWTDRRGAQLNRIRKEESKDPPRRLCPDCYELLHKLEDVEVECKNEGCTRTWTWKRASRVRAIKASGAKRAGGGVDIERVEPPDRMCETCEEFIRTHPPTVLACEECGSETAWSTENQLRVFLGEWKEPELCADCLRQRETSRSPLTQ